MHSPCPITDELVYTIVEPAGNAKPKTEHVASLVEGTAHTFCALRRRNNAQQPHGALCGGALYSTAVARRCCAGRHCTARAQRSLPNGGTPAHATVRAPGTAPKVRVSHGLALQHRLLRVRMVFLKREGFIRSTCDRGATSSAVPICARALPQLRDETGWYHAPSAPTFHRCR